MLTIDDDNGAAVLGIAAVDGLGCFWALFSVLCSQGSFIRATGRWKDKKFFSGVLMFHAWPVFTFVKEGREGEREIIKDINAYFRREISDKNTWEQ